MSILFGTNGDDNIVGGGATDLIISGDGNDIIYGNGGDDLISSGSGDDTVYGGDGNDVISSGSGSDTVYGGSGDNVISSGYGNDTIYSGDGNNLILGGSGNDLIFVGSGNNVIDGGSGLDTASFTGDAQDYSFSFLNGTVVATNLASGSVDVLASVENLTFDNANFHVGQNNAPIADDVGISVSEDGPAAAGDLLAASHAFDFEADALSIVAVGGDATAVGNQVVLASGALITINADGTYSYDPNGQFEALNTGETATDAVTFDISDGTHTITRTLDITIDGVDDNHAPVAQNVIYTVDADHAGGTYAFNAADPDPGDTVLTYDSPGMQTPPFQISLPQLKTDFDNNLDGTFKVVPGQDLQALAEGQTKDFTFTYTATDSHGAVSDEATLTFEITGVNDAPTRPNNIFARVAQEDSGPVVSSYQVIDPDSDDNSASLHYFIDVPEGLSIVDNRNGTFTLDTNVGFDHLAVGQSEHVLINFTATDRHGASTQFTDSIDVDGVNDNPIATDDGFATDEKTAFSGNLFADNGHGADTDPDNGDSFTVTAVNGKAVSDGDVVALVSGAEVTIHADGTFSYDPNGMFDALGAGDTADDQFTYTVTDTQGGTGTATATIAVAGVDDTAVAVPATPAPGHDGLLLVA